MTSSEMQIAFRANYNQILANKPRNILPQEVFLFLNWAYNAFVESYAKPKMVNPDNFTYNQHDLDSIRTLIKTESTLDNLELALDSGRVYVNLPSDYLHLVDDTSDTLVKCRIFNKVPNRLFASDIVSTILNSYLYGTNMTSPVSEIIDNRLYVYKSGFSITNVYIKYIQKYNPIDEEQSCKLPEFTHDRIVDMAVAKAKAVINDNGYEKFINESNKN